jgi:hypothetical protein
VALSKAEQRMTIGKKRVSAVLVLAFVVALVGVGNAGATTPRPKAHLSVSPASLTYRGGSVAITWSASHARRCTLSAKPEFWSGPNPKRVNCRGRLTQAVDAASNARHWTLTLRATNAGGRVAVVRRAFAVPAPPFNTSGNWSGYVVPSSSPVTKASGRFTVPTLNCSRTPNARVATWVGTGGDGGSSGDLLQTGISSICLGGVQYDDPAWWEVVPPLPEVEFSGMYVSPGDQIQASVFEASDGSWITRVDDLTTGVSGEMQTGQGWGTVLDSDPGTWDVYGGSAASVSYSGGYTAEWIVEDETRSDRSLNPLADFGTVSFTDLTTSPSLPLTTSDEVGLHDQYGWLVGIPSAPSSSGFSVTYTG